MKKEPDIKILLIEDDPMVREVNRMFIEKVDGFWVVGSAGNGADGLRLIEEMRPDLVFLDVFMPASDGIETIRRIRASGIPVDVIAVTAAKDPVTVETMLRSGVFDYIIKPFTAERVRESLERFRTVRKSIVNRDSFEQEEVDGLLRIRGKAASPSAGESPDDAVALPVETLPKGLHAVTMKQILHYLAAGQEHSSEEVADAVGIARVTARRYLDFLEKGGIVRLVVNYGSVGRPVNRYTLINDHKDQK